MNLGSRRMVRALIAAAVVAGTATLAAPAQAATTVIDTTGSHGPSQNKINTPPGGERTDLASVGPGSPSAWLLDAQSQASVSSVRIVFGRDTGGGNFVPDSTGVTGTVSVGLYADSAGSPGASLGSLAFASADADGFATFSGSVDVPAGPVWLQVQVADGGDWVNVAVYGTIVNSGLWTYTPSATGWYAFGMILDASYYGSPRFVMDGAATASSVVQDPAQLPADVIQQVPQPASGACDITDESLNWAGVPNGGWSLSWAGWANGGRGGPICTRTLFYNGARQAWAVRG